MYIKTRDMSLLSFSFLLLACGEDFSDQENSQDLTATTDYLEKYPEQVGARLLDENSSGRDESTDVDEQQETSHPVTRSEYLEEYPEQRDARSSLWVDDLLEEGTFDGDGELGHVDCVPNSSPPQGMAPDVNSPAINCPEAERCIADHEQSHINDVLANPSAWVCRSDGKVGTRNIPLLRRSECRAYRAHVPCLRQSLQSSSCKGVVRRHIRLVRRQIGNFCN